MRARGEKLLVEILRNSGNKSRIKAQPAVRKGETDFLYCPSAPATTRTVTIEGIRARKLYSKRVEKRFIQKEGGGVSFLEPPAPPRTGVTIALSWNRIHYTSLCQDEGACSQITFLCHTSFFVFPRCELHVVTVDVAGSSSSPPSSRYLCTTGHRCR